MTDPGGVLSALFLSVFAYVLLIPILADALHAVFPNKEKEPSTVYSHSSQAPSSQPSSVSSPPTPKTNPPSPPTRSSAGSTEPST